MALHLVVNDVEQTRAELVARGVQAGQVKDIGGGVRCAGLADPVGNTLTLQEMSWRTGEQFWSRSGAYLRSVRRFLMEEQ